MNSLTVEELAALVGGEIAGGSGAALIQGVAALGDAVEGQVSFFGNPKYAQALRNTRASAVLVPMDFVGELPAVRIRVSNPSLAFARLIEQFAQPAVAFPPGVDPRAVISGSATLGEGVSIQPFVVIEAGARIGKGTLLHSHTYVGHNAVVGENCTIFPSVSIREGCEIGNRVIIHCGAVIGSDGFGFENVNGKHVKIPQTGIVRIDDDVEIGANTTIDRARFGRTWIQEGSKIDNLVQIAHNVVVGKHSLIVAQAGISGSSKLGQYVTLAGQAGLVGHIEVGDFAIVAAKAGVSKNVPEKEVWLGTPATPMREQKEKFANINRLPKLFARVRKLEKMLDALGLHPVDESEAAEPPSS